MKLLHLPFVSRLLDLFTVCEEVKQVAWACGDWQEIGALSEVVTNSFT